MNTIRLDGLDDVVVARVDLDPGTPIPEADVTTTGRVRRGHKVATRPIAAGESVRKYGQVIGIATADIAPGDHVHLHNLGMHDFARDFAPGIDARELPPAAPRTFDGFLRETGRVGTRNFLGVLTTVNCSATVAHLVAETFPAEELARYEHVDGIVALSHGTGCGMAGRGDGFEALQRTLHGYIAQPNFAGVLLIGLGCEVNQIDYLLEKYGVKPGPAFQTFTMQYSGGTRKTVQMAQDALREMLPAANAARRTPQPASELCVALQCGGSDAWSGITANPALGAAADLVVRQGGTAILAETPEIYGAEHLLANRASTPEVAEKLIARVRWWEDYCARVGGTMDNNPTPGNKAGGLTTILEKSLGAVAKGGTSALRDVLEYAELATERGFLFMDTPGLDPASVTGQVAGGSNVICFTTGRGSCFGFLPTPSIKLATNTPMYDALSEDMDVNCGSIADGETTIEQLGEEIFELILRVASGETTKSELLGLGRHEFVPWQIGAVM